MSADLIYNALLRAERHMEEWPDRDPTMGKREARLAFLVIQTIREEIGLALKARGTGPFSEAQSVRPQETRLTPGQRNLLQTACRAKDGNPWPLIAVQQRTGGAKNRMFEAMKSRGLFDSGNRITEAGRALVSAQAKGRVAAGSEAEGVAPGEPKTLPPQSSEEP